MRFVIAGAGAIGAYMGARMARAGLDVILFARGPHLRAMQERGIQVRSAEGDFEARPSVSGDLEAIGPADVVFLGVKAHSLVDLAPRLKSLFGPKTSVVGMQNGVPWWFLNGTHLERVDPGVLPGSRQIPGFRRGGWRHEYPAAESRPGQDRIASRNWRRAADSRGKALGFAGVDPFKSR